MRTIHMKATRNAEIVAGSLSVAAASPVREEVTVSRRLLRHSKARLLCSKDRHHPILLTTIYHTRSLRKAPYAGRAPISRRTLRCTTPPQRPMWQGSDWTRVICRCTPSARVFYRTREQNRAACCRCWETDSCSSGMRTGSMSLTCFRTNRSRATRRTLAVAKYGAAKGGSLSRQGDVQANASSILQLSILEHASAGASRTPQGVVLALVSVETPESSAKAEEPPRTLRMYNLASLVSLVRWTTAQPVRERSTVSLPVLRFSNQDAHPVDLRRVSSPMDQTLRKKHGRHHSLVKGLKGLSVESPAASTAHPFPFPNTSEPPRQNSSTPPPLPPKDYEPSLRARASASPPVAFSPGPTVRTDSLDSTGSWDVVDDLPLRWATDFVPLASPGSKLHNMSVSFFEIWKSDNGRGRTMLAIATKSTIFLYETPQGARAFRHVKVCGADCTSTIC